MQIYMHYYGKYCVARVVDKEIWLIVRKLVAYLQYLN
ncbi:hypothetical protein MADA3029_570006 [Vibrio nigripulchritudo MADA3029]|nr:hypothetical protein VIBNIMADA3020_530055 [Vibrio nigripulchritudo MADA3020]CCN51279.1 hypothetical protein VIBNIMADA3021_1030054 [Vibrio nigripulchritudo MADA3021]CCN60319.1 hypothetical protein MADA3029_570006 [Vibrio nigripulchritudo MADA3029]